MADGKRDAFARGVSPEFESANSLSRRERRCLTALFRVLSRAQKGYDPQATQQLCRRHISVRNVLESNAELLEKEGVLKKSAELMSLIPSLARYSQRTPNGAHPHLNTLSAAEDYLKSLYIGVSIEQFYVLCLDSAGTLIQSVLLQKGTVDETPFYLSHLLKAAIDTQADAILLAHNHPGGTCRPSAADIACTQEALDALYALGIPMLDHVIVAGGKVVSLRKNGYLENEYWTRQDVFEKLNRQWLKIQETEASK